MCTLVRGAEVSVTGILGTPHLLLARHKQAYSMSFMDCRTAPDSGRPDAAQWNSTHLCGIHPASPPDRPGDARQGQDPAALGSHLHSYPILPLDRLAIPSLAILSLGHELRFLTVFEGY